MTLKRNIFKRLPDFYVLAFLLLIYSKAKLTSQLMGLVPARGVVLSSLAIALIAAAFSFLFDNKIRRLFLLLLNISLSSLLIADLWHYRYFGNPISWYRIYETSNLQGLGSCVQHVAEWGDFLLFADLLFLPLLFKLKHPLSKRSWPAFFSLLLAGVLLFAFHPIKSYHDGENILRRFDSADTIKNFGPLGFHVIDAAYFIKDRHLSLTIEQEAMISKWFKDKNERLALSQPKDYTYSAAGKNLILIQVESLQNFVIGKSVNGVEITPQMNKLLKHSLYFPSFYAQTVEGNSSDAELIVNTSLYPLKNGCAFFRYPNNKYFSLPYILKEEGYSTLAIHGDESNYWNRDLTYPNLGYEEFIDIKDFDTEDLIGMGLSDDAMFQQTAVRLREVKQPFLAFIITLTSHYPFVMPKKYSYLSLPEELEGSHLGNYFQSAHYTDKAIGNFIEQLEKDGLLEDSLIVIYGDHDGIFERDRPMVEELWQKKPISEEEWTRYFVNVPLIIYQSSWEGKTIDTLGGQIDLAPTLTRLLGLDTEKYNYYMMGEALLNKSENSVIIPSGDYITRARKISKDATDYKLDDTVSDTFDVSDLIIRSDYFSSFLKHN